MLSGTMVWRDRERYVEGVTGLIRKERIEKC
jgi:hypothetical protein